MKIYILLFASFLLLNGLSAQREHYCHTPEGKVKLQVSTDYFLVKFKTGTSPAARQSILEKLPGMDAPAKGRLTEWQGFSFFEMPDGVDETRVENWLEKLSTDAAVEFAHPFFEIREGVRQSYSADFVVGLKNAGDVETLRDFAKANQMEVIEQYPYDPRQWMLRATGRQPDALAAANLFAESGLFDYAEADFLTMAENHGVFSTLPPTGELSPTGEVPPTGELPPPPPVNDPDYPEQWQHNNDGDYCFIPQFTLVDADMDTDSAWLITTGRAEIKIAVIDNGVDSMDTELNLLQGYNAYSNDPFHTMSAGGHGTPVAWMAAAKGNNGVCVAGVAYDCSVVPVKVADPYALESNFSVCISSAVVRGFDWAWQDAGADVLTNSYGLGTVSAFVDNAIDRAVTKGRGGLGCPVFFSVGNDNDSTIAYPASNAQVIAVGASSPCDERKYTSSCDGENWGSNYGTGMDVLAPGVLIPLCNVLNCNTPLIQRTFGGTSASCPMAAGIAALILSKNPSLTGAQARQYLESNCDKINNATYTNVPGQPNGTWHSNYGYGRVNAHAAVAAVPAPDTTDVGISLINLPACGFSATTPITVTIDNYGSAAAANIPLEYRLKFNGGNFGAWTSAGTHAASIAGFGESTFTFNINAAATGDYTLEVRTQLSGDSGAANDGHSRDFSNRTISTFPYNEGFENNNGNWEGNTTSLWEWGTPTKDWIRTAATGTKGWFTKLSGNYPDNMCCAWVTSPCFDFSGFTQDPILAFNLIYQTQPRLSGTLMDYAWAEISSDGGITWSKLGAQFDGTNWYNDTVGWMGVTQNGPNVWLPAVIELNGMAGKSAVRLRFQMKSQLTREFEGFGFDDVSIFQPPANDAKMLSINRPDSHCSLGVETVEVGIQNLGHTNILTCPVEYRVNGGAWVSAGMYNGNIFPGTVDFFTFNYDFSAPGNYALEVRTQLPSDADATNDMAAKTISHYAAID
ncbi:MAG TPA: hypothetical protein ENJ95_02305, partial [Bacteroidetes bacterium]|nr:hypothetical protein [Bacteroidota bacterium]